VQYFTIAILFLNILITFSHNDWKLEKEEAGIKIYTRIKENSRFKELKLETTFESSLSALVALLTDKDSLKNWVYRCNDSYCIKKINEKEVVHYQATDAPWPLENRDIVVHTIVSQDRVTKVVTITAKSVQGTIPEERNKIRLYDYLAVWKLYPLGNGKVKGKYFLHLDPGGSIPAWMVNLGVSVGPVKSIVCMKNALVQYQKISLSFISE